METETLFELLKDYEDPCGRVAKGVRKTEKQWMARFALLDDGDCKIKSDWFKEVQMPIYNESDMVAFADYIIQHAHMFPKSSESENIYDKWCATRI